MKAKKYALSMIAVYIAYLTHGIQALIFLQNKVNFALQWGFDMSDSESAAYAAGVAAVSTAIAWTGFGKFCSVWIGGEISDRRPFVFYHLSITFRHKPDDVYGMLYMG